jgi:peroxiredoxin
VYVFHYSYRLPPPTSTSLALDRIGDFALTDQAGRTLRLGDLRGRKVLIVFYRGHW